MKDIALNVTNDLDFSKAKMSLLEGPELIKQKLKVRLLTFEDEHFLFQGEGLPYMDSILIKNPDISEIANLFAATILETEGVLRIVDLNTTYDPGLRTLLITFEVEIPGNPPIIITDSYDLNLSAGEDLLLRGAQL